MIGAAGAARRPVGADLIRSIFDAARRAPLAPEPFLVRGVALQLAGKEADAGGAFAAARDRDPRSAAAHFFLADHYGHIGQPDLAMTELGRLVRLVPGSSSRLAPQIAAAAREPGALPAARALIADNPQLRDDLLLVLAGDAANADLVAALAPAGGGPWLSPLVGRLVAAGEYQRARSLWQRGRLANSGQTGSGLTDPDFRLRDKPPFGWSLASGNSGVAEPFQGGGLHVVYFGRDRLVAASQLLLLPPGHYLLSYVAASDGELASMQWVASCDRGGAILGSAALGIAGARGRAAMAFAVPANCPAQRLKLIGSPGDTATTLDVRLSSLQLRRMP